MPDGLGVDEILDSYVKAKEDALALAEQDDALILLTNTETKKKVLFRKQPVRNRIERGVRRRFPRRRDPATRRGL